MLFLSKRQGGDEPVQNRIRSDPYRTTLVCIDSAQEGLLTGRVYHPYLPSGAEFKNLMQFLLVMEDLLDKFQFPQSFTAHRSFRMQPEPAPPLPSENEPHTGKIATFSVRVIFRQNASWQGSVTWLEEKTEENFRSVLELVLLMHSATSPEDTHNQAQTSA